MPTGPRPGRRVVRPRLAGDVPADNAVPDVLEPGLSVVFCGINPGVHSAVTGYHFAGPGNRFWPALFAAGFTDRLLAPSEVSLLPRYGCGITNLVTRTTMRAEELSVDEIVAGRRVLERKMRRFKPAWLAVLGVGAYRVAFGERRAVLGRQERTIGGTRLWLLPNTSGLNAHHRPVDFARYFTELRQAVRAEER